MFNQKGYLKILLPRFSGSLCLAGCGYLKMVAGKQAARYACDG